MNKKIMITGTKGYLGISFQKYIDKINNNMPPENQWHIVFLSVRDNSWKSENFGEYDAIIHVAAIVHKKEQPEMEQLYDDVNYKLTIELAEKYKKDRMAVQKKAHFIFMSTMSVYGIVRGVIGENTPTNPQNFYGKTKLKAEKKLLQINDLKVSIVRPPMIYGLHCSGNYASLEKLARKIPLFPNIKNQRSMLYVENLCELLSLLVLKEEDIESGSIYCPQNKEYVNTAELVAEIAKSYGKRMLLIPGFAWLVGLFANKIKVFAKVFGTLTYDKEMSVYPMLGDYQIVDFKESIRRSSGLVAKDDIEQNCKMKGICHRDVPSEKVSVLMSLYIREKPEYFRASMDSILNQTYPADEIILIEDGPLTDELYQAVSEYERLCNEKKISESGQVFPTLRVYAFKENQQLGRALAKGVELSSNEFIARMDTDDIAMPNRLYKETLYLENHPEVSVVGGAIREFNDEGTTDRIKYMPKTQDEIREYMKVRNPLNHMTVMYRKSAIMEIGNYQHFPFLEDYSLWSRMMSKDYQLRNMEDILVRARTSMGLVQRRSGWSYYKNFKKLRKLQHELGITNTLEYFKAIAGTFVVILMPGWVKELAYKKILRK